MFKKTSKKAFFSKRVVLTWLTVLIWISSIVWFSNAIDLDVADQFLTGNLANAVNYQSDINFKYDWNNFAGKLFLLESIDNIQTVEFSWTTKVCRKQVRWFFWNDARWSRMRPLDSQTLTEFQTIDPSYAWLTITGWLFANCDGDTSYIYGYIQHSRNWETYNMTVWTEYDWTWNQYLTNFEDNTNSLNNIFSWYIFDSYGWIWETNGTWILICDTTWIWNPATVCTTSTLVQTNDCGQTQTVAWTQNCTVPCTNTTRSPVTSTVCNWTSFTQTSNCGNTKTTDWTKSCTSTSGWGGWSSSHRDRPATNWWLSIDDCPNWDFSATVYDRICLPECKEWFALVWTWCEEQ